MKILSIALLALGLAQAQNTIRWSASTGDVSLSTAATAATLQQPASNGSDVTIDQVTVYCSVACAVSQAAAGAAATTTAGTVYPILPAQTNLAAPVNFFTASNVGSGIAQAGVTHVPAGGTAVLCLSRACGAAGDVVIGRGGGTASNYTVSIGSISGTANITFYLRSQQ